MGKNKRRREQIENELLAILRKSQQPDENLERLKTLNSNILNWHQGVGGKDIMKHPLLGSKLAGGNFLTAYADNKDKLIGKGVLGSKGLRGGKGEHAEDLALERQSNRKMAMAKMLQDSLDSELGTVQSNLSGLVGQDTNRSLQGAQIGFPLLKQVNSRIHPSFFQSLLGGVSGGAGAGISSLISKIPW